MKISNNLRKFYDANQDELENDFENYVLENEWGSGEDKIKITDAIFWEFIEERMEQEKQNEKSKLLLAMQRLPNWYKSFGWKIDLLVVVGVVVYLMRLT